MVTQEQFLTARRARGIDSDSARALYGELDAPSARRSTARFESQTTLSRLVQMLLYVGVLLVIGSHAWWWTITYRSRGSAPCSR